MRVTAKSEIVEIGLKELDNGKDAYASILATIYWELFEILGGGFADDVGEALKRRTATPEQMVESFWAWTMRTGGVQRTAHRDNEKAQEAGKVFIAAFTTA